MVRRRFPSTPRLARGLEQVGGALARVARDIEGGDRAVGRIGVAWASAAGRRLVRASRPLSLRDGRLRVAVRDAAWASNLEPFGPTLRGRLNEILGRDRVRWIEFVVKPEALDAAEEPRPAAPSHPRAAPADPADLAELEAAGVRDPDLRAAIARAMGAQRRSGSSD